MNIHAYTYDEHQNAFSLSISTQRNIGFRPSLVHLGSASSQPAVLCTALYTFNARISAAKSALY